MMRCYARAVPIITRLNYYLGYSVEIGEIAVAHVWFLL